MKSWKIRQRCKQFSKDFERRDKQYALEFEAKESKILSEIKYEELEIIVNEERENNSLDSDKNKEMINEAIKQVNIRLKPIQNFRKSAHIHPKHRSDIKVTSKCASCNFMTPCKERFDKHMIEHS